MCDLNQYDGRWTQWSETSNEVSFLEKSERGIGHGERKLCCELMLGVPNGQNKNFDININFENKTKGEVKSIKGNSNVIEFRFEANGRGSLVSVQEKLLNLKSLMNRLKIMSIESDIINGTIDRMGTLFTLTEIAESKIKKNGEIEMLCESLKEYKNMLYELCDEYAFFDNRKVKLTQLVEIKKILRIKLVGPKEKSAQILNMMNHEYIDNPAQLSLDVEELKVKMLQDYVLFFVHEQKGFYVVKNPERNVSFKRITQGTLKMTYEFIKAKKRKISIE